MPLDRWIKMKKGIVAGVVWVCLLATEAISNAVDAKDADPVREEPRIEASYKDRVFPKWISFDGNLTAEVSSNVSGGLKRKTGFLGNLDLVFDIDPEKGGWWENGHFKVYFLGDAGDKPTEYVGDLQGTSNIEAPDAFRLFEFWYEHAFWDRKLALLGGLYDLNSEFDVLEYAGLFLNSSFGIGVDISQVGPSIFPLSALAVRGRFVGDRGVYLMAAAFDGVPGDPDEPDRTAIILDRDDGIFLCTEAGQVHGSPAEANYYKVGLGGWFRTTDFEDYSGELRRSNGGVYSLAEASLTERIGIFFQLGFASDDRNQIGSYIGAGVNGHPVFCADDELGFAVAHARNADRYMHLNNLADRAETVLELTYSFPLSDSLSLQPDLQYVVHPSMDKTLDNAVVLGMRISLDF